MAEGAVRAGLTDAVPLHGPTDTPLVIQSLVLVRDHRPRGFGLQNAMVGITEIVQQLENVGSGGVRATPRSAEVAPIGAVPVPGIVAGDLALGGIANARAAKPRMKWRSSRADGTGHGPETRETGPA